MKILRTFDENVLYKYKTKVSSEDVEKVGVKSWDNKETYYKTKTRTGANHT